MSYASNVFCVQLERDIRNRHVAFSKACKHNRRRVCIVWVTSTSTSADGRNHNPKLICFAQATSANEKTSISQNLCIFVMACAHLKFIFLQWNALSTRSYMHHLWRVWINWEAYALSHLRQCKPRPLLIGKATLVSRIKYKPIPAHISHDNVDQRKAGSAKPCVLQENYMNQRQEALPRWHSSWTFGSSIAFVHHSTIGNFPFKRRLFLAHNIKVMLDVCILHRC